MTVTFTIPKQLECVRFVIEGEPVSKARARFTGYGSKARAYTPEKVKHAEERVAWLFRQAGGKFEDDAEVTFGVVATFYCGTRQRRDVDNMLKLILDGLNKVAWHDDNQVIEVFARKEFTETRTQARTEVAIYPVGRLDRLTAVCKECATEFVTYKSWGNRQYCTEDCALKQRRLARLKTCENCGITWDPGKPSQRRFCSRECQTASGWTTVPCDHCHARFRRRRCHIKAVNYCSPGCRDATFKEQRKLRSKGVCSDCGGSTSDKRAVRCQPCQWAHRAANKKGSAA